MPTLSNPVLTALNTAVTNAMGNDGFNWSANNVKIIDKFGKSIVITENSVGDHFFTYSNDGEVTWVDAGPSLIALERGDMAYDAINDKIHIFWKGSDPVTGMLYRRHDILRDGAHNITSIPRDMSVNTRIDFQGQDASDPGATMIYAGPAILFLDDIGTNGAVYLQWTAINTEASVAGMELRATMRVLTNTSADDVLANWKTPTGVNSPSLIGNRPGGGALAHVVLAWTTLANVKYGPTNSTLYRPSVGVRSKCLYTAYYFAPDAATLNIAFRRMNWNAAAFDWSTGGTSVGNFSAMVRAGSDIGYNRKWELLSKYAYNPTNDCLYICFPTWKSNTDGDTVSVIRLDCANNDALSSLVDVYSAGGAHSFAPTCDLVWDDADKKLAVTYLKTTTQAAAVKTYDNNLVLDQPELIYATNRPFDIPYVYQSRINNKFVSLLKATDVPMKAFQVTLDWAPAVIPPDPTPPVTPHTGRGSSGSRGLIPREFPWMTEEQKRAIREQRSALLGR